ncbi:virulence factor TspB C-terminal domain-related protein [Xanthomonas translucens]|uniref:virulence factor TspB C-terminal domain-related protein n=1 Tax=Xanthomonas campestris pv. translucens TaxID=343 RepID=UPI0011B28D0E|nr:virulence factor TspB C-terminal domain-related protein [Xanthomonas translucens]
MALWLGVVSVASSGINVNPTSARYAAATATGIRSTVTLEATLTGSVNGVRNYAVPVEIPSSTLGNLAKGALKRGLGWYNAYQVVKSIIDGAGWVINELKQEVLSGPPAPTQVPPNGTYYVGSDGKYYSNAVAAANGMAAFRTSVDGEYNWSFVSILSQSGSIISAKFEGLSRTSSQKRTITDYIAVRVNDSNSSVAVSDAQPAQVTDTQLGDAIRVSPQAVNAILIDPVTGAPIRTQEITDAMNALRKQLEAANSVPPGPDAMPTPDTSTTQPMDSEWPTFCGWASKVCDFIDWVRSDGEPEKELPEHDIDIDPNGWSSGISGGSCPAAETFTVNVAGSQGQGEFSWQPLCDFSILLRPFLIAVASVAAVMILAGLRSSSAK